MKLDKDPEEYLLTLIREPGEPAVKDESQLFHRLKKVLQGMGEDVIKKLMWKDGHMVDERQHYVRSRKYKERGAYAIHDPEYIIRNAAEEYNRKGKVDFEIVGLGDWEPVIRSLPGAGILDWWPPR